MKYVFLIGRVLFSLIFLIKPLEHFSQYAIEDAAQMGVPFYPVMVPLWGLIGIAGALSVMLGFKAKIGAWLIVVFLFPTTFIMHPFWHEMSSFANKMHSFCFWKNLSLMGAALMITYQGSGPLSVK